MSSQSLLQFICNIGTLMKSECSSAPWKACISLRECLQVQQTAKTQGPDQGDGSDPGHKGTTEWLFFVCVSVVWRRVCIFF